MANTMTVKWTCDLHGVEGRIVYDVPVTNEIAFRDALNAHQFKWGANLWGAAKEHLEKFHISVRRKRAASTQPSLFDGG